MFNNNSNNEGERRPRPRIRREGAEPVSRPRFTHDGETRPRFTHDGETRPRFTRDGESRPRFTRDGETRPRFTRDGETRPQRPFGAKPKRNPGLYSGHKQQVYREQHEDPTKPVRLNKYLANAGICSRREADDFIQAGVITVNGETVDSLGAKVLPTDDIRFHDQPVRRERKVYILLNKPKNTVTTTDDPQERHTVIDIVRNACAERIYPVGRLDRNTTGVLLLTNDGDLAAKLTHPKFRKKKRRTRVPQSRPQTYRPGDPLGTEPRRTTYLRESGIQSGELGPRFLCRLDQEECRPRQMALPYPQRGRFPADGQFLKDQSAFEAQFLLHIIFHHPGFGGSGRLYDVPYERQCRHDQIPA